MSFDFHRPGVTTLTIDRNSHYWHFTSDPVTPEQTTMEELFELGYVKLESWKWTDRFVRSYKLTKLGRSEYQKWRRAINRRVDAVLKRV